MCIDAPDQISIPDTTTTSSSSDSISAATPSDIDTHNIPTPHATGRDHTTHNLLNSITEVSSVIAIHGNAKQKESWEEIQLALLSPTHLHAQVASSLERVAFQLTRIERSVNNTTEPPPKPTAQAKAGSSKKSYSQAAAAAANNSPPPASSCPTPKPEKNQWVATIRTPHNETTADRNRSPKDLAKAITSALPQLGGSLRTVTRFPSGDVKISVSNEAAHKLLLSDESWVTKVFGDDTQIRRRSFPVMVHGLPLADFPAKSATDCSVDADTVREKLLADNPDVARVTITRASWSPRAIEQGKSASSLRLELASPIQANLLCDKGLVYEYSFRRVEPYSRKAELKLCTRCAAFGHSARYCRAAKEKCGFCSQEHSRSSCPSAPPRSGTTEAPTQISPAKCPNCDGAHPAWDKSCRVREAAAAAAHERRLQRPARYSEPPQAAPTPRASTKGKRRRLRSPDSENEA